MKTSSSGEISVISDTPVPKNTVVLEPPAIFDEESRYESAVSLPRTLAGRQRV